MLPALKFVMTAIGFVLILTGIAGFFLFREAGQFATDRFETAFAEAFTAPVRIGDITINPFTRTIDARDVVVSNPDGFKQGTAFESKRIRLDIDPKTIFSENPVVHRALIEDADIYYRYELGEGFNIDKLTERAEAAAENGQLRRFILEEIRCEDARVHFSTNLVPKTSVGMNLVDVTLEDVNAHQPVTPRKAAAIFFKSLAKEIVTLRGLVRLPEIEPEA